MRSPRSDSRAAGWMEDCKVSDWRRMLSIVEDRTATRDSQRSQSVRSVLTFEVARATEKRAVLRSAHAVESLLCRVATWEPSVTFVEAAVDKEDSRSKTRSSRTINAYQVWQAPLHDAQDTLSEGWLLALAKKCRQLHALRLNIFDWKQRAQREVWVAWMWTEEIGMDAEVAGTEMRDGTEKETF